MLVLQVAVAMTALYAFVHAAMQRPDAYTAADKMTKPVWLLILGASVPLTMMLSALGRDHRQPARQVSTWSMCGPNSLRYKVSRDSLCEF